MANIDDRLAAMIAAIVESFGRYNSSRGRRTRPIRRSRRCARRARGQTARGLLAPYGEEARPPRSRSPRHCGQTHFATATDVEAETKRRTASNSVASTCRCTASATAENVEFLRAPESSCVRCVACRSAARTLARGCHAAPPVSGRRNRSAKDAAKSMSTGACLIDVVLKKPHPARPDFVVLCDVSGSSPAFSHFTCSSSMRFASNSPAFACSPSSTPPTRSGAVRPDADLAVAVQRITRRRASTPRWPLRLRPRVRVVPGEWPERAVAAQLTAVLGDARNNYRNPGSICSTTW